MQVLYKIARPGSWIENQIQRSQSGIGSKHTHSGADEMRTSNIGLETDILY